MLETFGLPPTSSVAFAGIADRHGVHAALLETTDRRLLALGKAYRKWRQFLNDPKSSIMRTPGATIELARHPLLVQFRNAIADVQHTAVTRAAAEEDNPFWQDILFVTLCVNGLRPAFRAVGRQLDLVVTDIGRPRCSKKEDQPFYLWNKS